MTPIAPEKNLLGVYEARCIKKMHNIPYHATFFQNVTKMQCMPYANRQTMYLTIEELYPLERRANLISLTI